MNAEQKYNAPNAYRSIVLGACGAFGGIFCIVAAIWLCMLAAMKLFSDDNLNNPHSTQLERSANERVVGNAAYFLCLIFVPPAIKLFTTSRKLFQKGLTNDISIERRRFWRRTHWIVAIGGLVLPCTGILSESIVLVYVAAYITYLIVYLLLFMQIENGVIYFRERKEQ